MNNNIFIFHKNRLKLFTKFFVLLVAIGLFERIFFAIYHNYLLEPFSTNEIIYTILWGMKFDAALAATLSLISLIIVYLLDRVFSIQTHTSIKYLAYILGSSIFFLQGADIIYFSDASRHIGYEITDTFNDAENLLATAWVVYKTPLLIQLSLYPILLFIIGKFFNSKLEPYNKLNGLNKLHLELSSFVFLIIFLIFGRGGFQSIPLEPLHAHEISDSTKASLALNGAYNALYYLVKKDLIKPIPINISKQMDMDTILKNMYSNNNGNKSVDSQWKPNIIFILLESWPAMYMKSYGYNKSTTPFFDSLREKSLTSLQMLAGGHRTTEGMFSSFCSAQNPLGQSIAQSQLQDFQYHCLPHILRDEGYRTAFFQGSNKNTSGTGAFAQLLGFNESYGKADIKNRKLEENYWGVYDQDLYNYVYTKMKSSTSPLFIGINTNTTHDIVLPENISAHFKASPNNHKILNTLYFADSELKEFFNKVENTPEMNDTIWVVVADHTAGLKSSRLNNYSVPFLIYHKNKIKPQFVNRVTSHRDITPTLLNLLDRKIPNHFTGKAINQKNNTPYFSDYYHSGTLGWIEDNLLIEIPLSSSNNIDCYYYMDDKPQKNKISCPESAIGLKDRALSFTYKYQKLLFDGQSKQWSY